MIPYPNHLPLKIAASCDIIYNNSGQDVNVVDYFRNCKCTYSENYLRKRHQNLSLDEINMSDFPGDDYNSYLVMDDLNAIDKINAADKIRANAAITKILPPNRLELHISMTLSDISKLHGVEYIIIDFGDDANTSNIEYKFKIEPNPQKKLGYYRLNLGDCIQKRYEYANMRNKLRVQQDDKFLKLDSSSFKALDLTSLQIYVLKNDGSKSSLKLENGHNI